MKAELWNKPEAIASKIIRLESLRESERRRAYPPTAYRLTSLFIGVTGYILPIILLLSSAIAFRMKSDEWYAFGATGLLSLAISRIPYLSVYKYRLLDRAIAEERRRLNRCIEEIAAILRIRGGGILSDDDVTALKKYKFF